MTNISRAWWLVTGLVAALWIVSEPDVLTVQGFIPIRNLLVQASGILAIIAMSVAMLLALRPRWPERWFGGLDKMYRLHKWLGITALSASIFHWVASNAPKWAVQAGIMERGQRPPRQAADNVIEQALNGLRHPAEFAGEWTFYFAALLMVLALVKWFPYRLFFKTHRLLAAAYLILVFHAVVLTKFAYWTTPVGLVLALTLAAGTWAAIIVLLRRIAKERQVDGQIGSTQYYPGVHALEFSVDVPQGWTGHKPGQFAFVTLDEREGPHPFTIASAWDASQPRITFIVKELGRPYATPTRQPQSRTERKDRRPVWLLHLRRRGETTDLDWWRHRHHAVRRAHEATGRAQRRDRPIHLPFPSDGRV